MERPFLTIIAQEPNSSIRLPGPGKRFCKPDSGLLSTRKFAHRPSQLGNRFGVSPLQRKSSSQPKMHFRLEGIQLFGNSQPSDSLFQVFVKNQTLAKSGQNFDVSRL